LAAEFKSNGTFQTTKLDASLHPQRNTVKREICKEMAGNRNRPQGLLLERRRRRRRKNNNNNNNKKMMIFLL
jgi:hypothetical protein